MWAAIAGALIPFAMELIRYFLNKKNAENQTIEAFYKFIQVMSKDSKVAVKVSKSYEKALDEIKEKKKNRKVQAVKSLQSPRPLPEELN